jgi:hypothetical protein
MKIEPEMETIKKKNVKMKIEKKIKRGHENKDGDK